MNSKLRQPNHIENSRDSEKEAAQKSKGDGDHHAVAELVQGFAEVRKCRVSNSGAVQIRNSCSSRARAHHRICEDL